MVRGGGGVRPWHLQRKYLQPPPWLATGAGAPLEGGPVRARNPIFDVPAPESARLRIAPPSDPSARARARKRSSDEDEPLDWRAHAIRRLARMSDEDKDGAGVAERPRGGAASRSTSSFMAAPWDAPPPRAAVARDPRDAHRRVLPSARGGPQRAASPALALSLDSSSDDEKCAGIGSSAAARAGGEGGGAGSRRPAQQAGGQRLSARESSPPAAARGARGKAARAPATAAAAGGARDVGARAPTAALAARPLRVAGIPGVGSGAPAAAAAEGSLQPAVGRAPSAAEAALLAEFAQAATPAARRQLLGDRLYPRVAARVGSARAREITGMLLATGLMDVLEMLSSEFKLGMMVLEAMQVLADSRGGAGAGGGEGR